LPLRVNPNPLTPGRTFSCSGIEHFMCTVKGTIRPLPDEIKFFYLDKNILYLFLHCGDDAVTKEYPSHLVYEIIIIIIIIMR